MVVIITHLFAHIFAPCIIFNTRGVVNGRYPSGRTLSIGNRPMNSLHSYAHDMI